MNWSTWWAAGVALAALAQAGSVQAQIVHKCIVDGAAVYQAAACPAANDQKSLVIPSAPSQQELLDATANGRLQTVQPSAEPPVTAAGRRYGSNRVVVIQTTQTHQELARPATAAADNCEQLNQSYHEASYRRDELSAPGTGATRGPALQRAIDDMKRLQEQANTAHCHLR